MGLQSSDDVALGGTIRGTYPIYAVRVEIPALPVARRVRAGAIPNTACRAGMNGLRVFGFSAGSPTATVVLYAYRGSHGCVYPYTPDSGAEVSTGELRIVCRLLLSSEGRLSLLGLAVSRMPGALSPSIQRSSA
jgi:hypothetical protein